MRARVIYARLRAADEDLEFSACAVVDGVGRQCCSANRQLCDGCRKGRGGVMRVGGMGVEEVMWGRGGLK